MNTVAVETSDIVGSTKLESSLLKNVMHALNSQLEQFKSDYNVHFEFYRGDGFQILYPDIQNAFRLSLSLKLSMLFRCPKKIHITQSLAFDAAQLPITSLHNRMDRVFITSGRLLEKTAKGHLNTNLSQISESQRLLLDWFNQNIKSISAKQAEILYWFVLDDFPEQKKIAGKLCMTRQNVNAQLKRVNANLIKRYILLIEKQLLERSR